MLGFSDGVAHARGAGIRTAVLAPQFSLEDILRIDHPIQLNLGDEISVRKELVKLDKAYRVLGVVAFDDSLVALAAHAKSWLGLNRGPNPESVRRCLRKDEMRRALAEDSSLAIPYKCVGSPDELEDAVNEIGLPCVVKPVESSNSRHVHFCDTKAGAIAAGAKVLEWSLNAGAVARVLIEPFLEGPEFSVESYTFEGKTVVMAVCEKVLGPLPYFVEIGHFLPTRHSKRVEELAAETARKALSLLQVNDLVTHTEVRLTPAGCKVVEINPRPAGGRLREFIHTITGYDLHGVSIQIAAGREPTRYPATAAQGIYHCITADVAGKVVYDLSYLRRPLQIGAYPIVELTVNNGEQVFPVNHKEGKVLGRILAYGQNFETTAEEVRRILRELSFQIIPNSNDAAQAQASPGNHAPLALTLSAPAEFNTAPNPQALYVPAWLPGMGWTWLVAHPAGLRTEVRNYSTRFAEVEPATSVARVREDSCQGGSCGKGVGDAADVEEEVLPEEPGAWNRGCC